MAIILNIDTAQEAASVCISSMADPIKMAINHQQKDHAAWLHTAIQNLLKDAALTMNDLNAIAVSIGPGSYTGLRVGLSAAKGLCYALHIPLITIGTLDIMARSVKNTEADLVCPLIDARRMEVFTAIYDKSMSELQKPAAMIINESSFSELLASNTMTFCGSGVKKLQAVVSNKHAFFSTDTATASNMCPISYQYFAKNIFADVAYTEPLYIKEFFSIKH